MALHDLIDDSVVEDFDSLSPLEFPESGSGNRSIPEPNPLETLQVDDIDEAVDMFPEDTIMPNQVSEDPELQFESPDLVTLEEPLDTAELNKSDDLGMVFDDSDMDFDVEPDFEPVQPTQVELVEVEPVHVEPVYGSRHEPEPVHQTMHDPVGSMPSEAVSMNAPVTKMAPLPQAEVPVYQTRDPQSDVLAQESGYQAGDQVVHEKYGEGTVEKMIPMDDRVTLKILFDQFGKRLLDAGSTLLKKR